MILKDRIYILFFFYSVEIEFRVFRSLDKYCIIRKGVFSFYNYYLLMIILYFIVLLKVRRDKKGRKKFL